MTFDGAMVDLDGTVYRGDDPIPGAREGIDALRARGVDVLFVSNNPTRAPGSYVEKLAGMGIETTVGEVLTSGVMTREYLEAEHAGDAIYLVGEAGLRDQLSHLHLTTDPADADVVVGSIDRELTYDTLREVLRAFLEADPAFVGTDPDRIVPADDGEYVPGSGAIAGSIAATVGRDPDPMLGKPSAAAIEAVLDRLDHPPERCLAIGDRLDTDLALGERAGMTTALVRTGVHDRSDVANHDVTPDHVLGSLGEVEELL